MSLNALGLAEAAAGIGDGRLSSAELVGDCLKRIGEADGAIQAWAFLDRDHAMRQAEAAGMTAGAGGHRDHAVDAGLDRLSRMMRMDDVGEHQPAVFVHRPRDVAGVAEARDHKRHAVLDHQREVVFQPGVGRMQNQVDAVRRIRRAQR